MGDLTVFADLVLLCGLPLGAIYAGLRWYQHWLSLPRAEDIPRIKAELEANEHRVVDIQSAGFERGALLSRYGQQESYRKYRVTVRSPLGGPDEVQIVGVQAGFLAFRRLKYYGPRRHFDFAAPSS